ncbi:MAG: M13 family metallopeptidase, partial [Sphingomonadaceae bacterium]
ALPDKAAIPALIAYFQRSGYSAPYGLVIHQDNKDSSQYVADLVQDGLGLPDRDYYLNRSDRKLAATLAQYQQHIARMLALAGQPQAAAEARAIVGLETALARLQWSKVALRDPVKAYNKLALAQLGQLTPGYDWPAYLQASGLAGKTTALIVSQPSYLKGVNQLLAQTPLAVWQAYFRWQVIHAQAPYLARAFAQEHFAFYGTVLGDIKEQEARWKRAVSATDEALGDSLGRLYVAKYFPAERKARMELLVQNLLAAYQASVDQLDWMSPATKKEAQAKLAKFSTKIAYPAIWRDYSGLELRSDDLAGNLRRSAAFNYDWQLGKLGRPVDRQEWGMTPQTVNAYYDAEKNEIVFPAAILQPPFFDASADDAANYGAIGAIIGHEISHGFDDEGSQFDGDGNLRDWWTAADHRQFAARSKRLVQQYSGYSPLPGYHVNGALTLGENIADNSGLAIAFKAYQLALQGQPAPVIDGLSGAQRFYMGYAQAWRSKTRDAQAIVYLKTDPHAPDRFRANGTLRNQPGFYTAFGIQPGDKMYLSPKDRVTLW